MLKLRVVSSLEKQFLDQSIEVFKEVKRFGMLRDQHLSFQVLYIERDQNAPHRSWMSVRLSGKLADYAELRTVEYVPVLQATYPDKYDDNYLRTEPGLYPDILQPLHMNGKIPVVKGQTRSLWVDIDTCGAVDGGDYPLKIQICNGDEILAETEIGIHIIDAFLPEQSLRVTQWFHCDCLADWYGVEVFSEDHWRIIENFASVAVKNGIDTLLTPVFTPPLDTYIGGERPTVQLVGVKKLFDGTYTFDYTLLDRWIDMCDRIGVRYFEISHLFTQWGAVHAPKIVARVDGSIQRIFGWDTDITGVDCEYAVFIRAFLSSFISHMKERGDDKRCIFHISDEPNEECLEQYKLSKSIVADLLEGYTCMDALSNIEYYERGIVTVPVAANNRIKDFIDAKVPHLWTYYCCGQSVGVSNRYLSMPGARTRVLGMQCFKYGIKGFLQWGYNFYYNQGSYDLINPYFETSGEYFVPAGDAYSVYPAPNGTALESVRLLQFREGLEDYRAMELCANIYGRDAVIRAIEDRCGEIDFYRCPYRAEEMQAMRDIVDGMIEEWLEQK